MPVFTTASLQRFVGGQIEVKNERARLNLRGEIKTVEVRDVGSGFEIVVTPAWMATGQSYHNPTIWIAHEAVPYTIKLREFNVRSASRPQINLYRPSTTDIRALYTPGVPGLISRASVQGL